MNLLGILGLGSISTTYYIEALNIAFQKKYGGYSTCPFIMINTNFDDINPYLPNDFINLRKNILPYLKKIDSLKVDYLLIPNITIHQAIDKIVLEENFNFKLIHPIDELMDYLKLNNINNITVLGTKHTMQGDYIQNIAKQHDVAISQISNEQIVKIDEIRKQVYINSLNIDKDYLFQFEEGNPESKIVLACTELSVIGNQNPHFIDLASLQIQKAINTIIQNVL